MDAQLVYHRFLLLAGLPEQQNAALFSLCEEAARELERRLRPGAEHTSPRLIYPAAAMALARYCLAGAAAEDAGSFTAGDIHVTKETATAIAAAQRMERDALNSVADLLEDDSFCFCAIGGAP